MFTDPIRGLLTDQLGVVQERRNRWCEQAQDALPERYRKRQRPGAIVDVVRDAEAYQGWNAVPRGFPEDILGRALAVGDSFVLDFGTHVVGHLVISLARFGPPIDAPVRLGLVFGEVAAEIGESFDTYRGSLSRSWLQDELVNFDEVPQTVTLPRRYAFRYVKLTVVAAGHRPSFGLRDIVADAVTSADETALEACDTLGAQDEALYAVALRTLRNCMQSVFEDGPKRDRRLWLGDLRLQALSNYATYRNHALVRRCLYLLAGTCTEGGLVATSVVARPEPVRGVANILDYTALFAPTVLEYLAATGDRDTAADLWPLVLRQLAFTLHAVDPRGLFVPEKGWWLFVDWNGQLDKQAAEHATVLYGLRATLALGRLLGCERELAELPGLIDRMVTAARAVFWAPSCELFISGPGRQISWASQVWMCLAGVLPVPECRTLLLRVFECSDAVKPVTPYLYHYVVDALFCAGLSRQASQLMHQYWGGMLKKGAVTFWEVFVPDNDYASPYASHLVNSYCHAWSCTPAYFIRRYRAAG